MTNWSNSSSLFLVSPLYFWDLRLGRTVWWSSLIGRPGGPSQLSVSCSTARTESGSLAHCNSVTLAHGATQTTLASAYNSPQPRTQSETWGQTGHCCGLDQLRVLTKKSEISSSAELLSSTWLEREDIEKHLFQWNTISYIQIPTTTTWQNVTPSCLRWTSDFSTAS